MLQLQLRVIPANGRVVAGETLPVGVMTVNTGTEPEPIVDLNDSKPYEYTLYAADDLQPRYVLSTDLVMNEVVRAPQPPRKSLPPYMLKAGRKIEYQQDLATMTTSPLAPGRYLVEAAWRSPAGRLVSNRAPLEITAPSFLALVSETGRLGSPLAVVAAAQTGSNSRLLLQEPVRRQPGIAPWFPLAQLDASPVQVAAAVDVEPTAGGRWLAWLQGGVFHAIFGHGSKVKASPSQPFPSAVTLLPVGFQYSDRTATFLLYAERADRQGLAKVQVSTQDGIQIHRPIEVAGVAGVNPFPTMRAGEQLELYWAATANGRTEIVRQTIDLAASVAGPRSVLADLPGEFAACDVRRVDAEHIHVLLMPDAEETLRLYRIAIKGAGYHPEPVVVLPAPGDAIKEWAVLAEDEQHTILAISAESVWWTQAARHPTWRQMNGTAPGSRQPKLFSFDDGKVWAQWIEPVRGVMRAML